MALCCRIRTLFTKTHIFNNIPQQLTKRLYGSYKSSPFIEDIGPVTTQYEVTKDPEEWKYVERILPIPIVPQPIKKDNYPSGWKPPGEISEDMPYCVLRSRNHMLPVYMEVQRGGACRRTVVRKIKGDIWLLEKELREFLEPERSTPLRIYVNELGGYLRMNGDYVNAIKYFLEQKNF